MGNKNLGIFILIATSTVVAQATWVGAAEDVKLGNKHIALTSSSGSCNAVTEYIVGDDKGWTKNVDYKAWAEGKEFKIGDILVFNMPDGHNLLAVDEDGYNRCCGVSRVIDIHKPGRHSIVLTAQGNFGFISRAGSDCQDGMKLLVIVK